MPSLRPEFADTDARGCPLLSLVGGTILGERKEPWQCQELVWRRGISYQEDWTNRDRTSVGAYRSARANLVDGALRELQIYINYDPNPNP